MRIGVAGVGRIGAFHARTLSELDEIDSLVLADAITARAVAVAEELDVDHVSAPSDLFTAGIDGLVIAAATDAHAGLILGAVDAGIPVFCEKPMPRERVPCWTRCVRRPSRCRSASNAASMPASPPPEPP